MNPIKIAVIGIGHLGFIHAKLLKNVDYAELSGFLSLMMKELNILFKNWVFIDLNHYNKL